MGSLGETAYDVIIIGAGMSGLSSLHNIRQRFPNWSVKVLEAGPSVGGTWFYNCYPGARFDSESYTYQFSWDKELIQEWTWSEAFAAQPETLRYIERFAEKNGLYRNIQFNEKIESARWSEYERAWRFTASNGSRYKATFFISCLGVLSNPSLPDIAGIDDFRGESYHTARWPKNFDVSRDFAGKRVGVIGTGATGMQLITTLSKEPSVRSLSVFQRTPTWAAPLRNHKLTEEDVRKYKAESEKLFDQCDSTPALFMHRPDPRKFADTTDEERLALWEKLYSEPGFGKWLSVFWDTYFNAEANKQYSAFMADKIRKRVNDPVVAEKLIPKTHGFGTSRVSLESGYYEAFNQPNVRLVDLLETPIARITTNGIATADGEEHPLDVLIYATGFNSLAGSFSKIEWSSKSGRPLFGQSNTEKGKRAIWADLKPSTHMGVFIPDMPNMFMILGPHQPFGNVARSIEHGVKFTMSILERCRDEGYTYVESTQEACDEWTAHILKCSQFLASSGVNGWVTGVSPAADGKSLRQVARYPGSAVDYRQRCDDFLAKGCPGIIFQ